jgi:chromosomal replication initiation ATPase DnaA
MIAEGEEVDIMISYLINPHNESIIAKIKNMFIKSINTEMSYYSPIRIIDIINQVTGINDLASKRKNRKKELVLNRQLKYYFLNNHTNMTLSERGKFVANQDHATAFYGYKRIKELVDINDKEICYLIKEIEKMLKL